MIHYNLFGKVNKLDFKPRQYIRLILREIFNSEHLKGDYAVSFIIVNNEEIHKINKEYRNIDRPTDVISFAVMDGNNHQLDYELGDIYLSYEKIIEQAKEYNHSNIREFSFLITHGMLHLLGYDHMNPKDEEIMFKKQDDILNKVGIVR